MLGKKIYLQPAATVLNAVNDLIEIQKASITFTDTPNGRIFFTIEMYGFKKELRFTIMDVGKNRCQTQIEASGEVKDREKLIRREFALLESMLTDVTRIEIEDMAGGQAAAPAND